MLPTRVLLNTIEGNSRMAHDLLVKLLGSANDECFAEALKLQIEEYAAIAKEADNRLCGGERTVKVKKARKCALSSMDLTLLLDKSTERMAEMIILGSTMGIIDIVRALKEYDGYDEQVLGMAIRLKETEENNIKAMLEFA
ncbi:MAG: hypothetical protein RRY79_00980 [Clostridia bacterium]